MTTAAAGQRVLILFAHPALHRSRVNRALVRAVRDVAGVTFHDLYESYPDFDVDVRREQQLLLAHDLIVLEDDPYGLVRFDGEPLPSLFELSDGATAYSSSVVADGDIMHIRFNV